jgi:hypothetical protein
MTDYFKATVSRDGISGDDVNRRYREARLGFAAPSEDWNQSHLIVRAIYPGQWETIDTGSMSECILWDMAGIRALHVVTGLQDLVRPLSHAGEEPDLYDEAYKPDPDCMCLRDDCHNCNITPLDDDGDPVIPSLRATCQHRRDFCPATCDVCVYNPDNEGPPSLTVTDERPQRIPDRRIAFDLMNHDIAHAGAQISKAQERWVKAYKGCKHYEQEHNYCDQCGDACSFRFCPRLTTEALDY